MKRKQESDAAVASATRELVLRHRGSTDDGRPTPIAEVARRAGVTRSYLYYLFRGERRPRRWFHARLAVAIGVRERTVREALQKDGLA